MGTTAATLHLYCAAGAGGLWVNTEVALLTIPAVICMLIGGAMLTFLQCFLFRPREMWRDWGPIPIFFSVIFGPFMTLTGISFPYITHHPASGWLYRRAAGRRAGARRGENLGHYLCPLSE
jgi:hypothetical protein